MDRTFLDMPTQPFPGLKWGPLPPTNRQDVHQSDVDDGTNLKRSLQIEMKALMGDAVGNVSTSLEIAYFVERSELVNWGLQGTVRSP